MAVTQTGTPQFQVNTGTLHIISEQQLVHFFPAFSQFSAHRKFSVLMSSANKHPIFHYFCHISQAQGQKK